MPAPPYIRFFHEAYCQDTIKLTMEEQGAYIRLLCAMWRNGGKIVHDDSVIAQSLPINTNKWFKVKPALMPFLKEDEGFLTQNRLAIEYHFSSGDKKANKGSKPSDAPPAAGEAAPHAAPHAAWGAAPHATPHAVQGSDHAPPNQNALAKQDIGSVLANGLTRACARALDQSKSRRDKNRKTRFLEDELYRSGQFTESDIQKYAHKHGIRSIINLRGDNTGQEWYDDEVRDAKAAGIKHLNFRMSSKQVLTSAELIQLIRMMERAPKPVLIHCNGGANRTSFAVAVYLAAIKKADERTAEAQMSIRFGNFPEWMGSRSKMSYNFEMIEAMLGYEGS